MVQQRDVSRSTTAFVPDETLIVVVEMSRSTWLVAGLLPVGPAVSTEAPSPAPTGGTVSAPVLINPSSTRRSLPRIVSTATTGPSGPVG
jgi:hypothetical protein